MVAILKLAWRKTWTSNQLNISSEAYSVYPKTRPANTANLKLHSALIIHRQDEYRFICGLSVSLFLNIYVYLNTWWIKFILFNVSHLLKSTLDVNRTFVADRTPIPLTALAFFSAHALNFYNYKVGNKQLRWIRNT